MKIPERPAQFEWLGVNLVVTGSGATPLPLFWGRLNDVEGEINDLPLSGTRGPDGDYLILDAHLVKIWGNNLGEVFAWVHYTVIDP